MKSLAIYIIITAAMAYYLLYLASNAIASYSYFGG